ncbi:metallophosphoesterase [Xenorhabdus sp. DI]|uniref:metallophosphoesterase family protein n=1 Tax=Xenorhabdus doucetiae TaxID=351671 RepID=UPI0019A3CB1B|nr:MULTISPECIES: metallophosphoesterase [unclassified Xenorhabdus]MBD2783125.1 metallophosphoesterase [Xenorhabdus sp. 3]MBD2790258.1 metallophosphoesterase [Xenorhabdus sp. DI]
MKVIHLSDIHLTRNRDQKLFDVNPYENFDFVCEEILRIKNLNEIALIIVSGDIANDGDVEAYRYFLQKMESLRTPYIAILGNHDLKENFNIALTEKINQFMIHSRQYKNNIWRVISVDTVVEGEDFGFISKDNLAELEKEIVNSSDFNIAIFMHHHAIPVGTPIVDNCMLNNGKTLLDLCEKYKVKFIGSGHAHTSRIWHHNTMTTSVAPAVVFQWLPGIETVKISKGFGFNIIDFSSDLSITSCIY